MRKDIINSVIVYNCSRGLGAVEVRNGIEITQYNILAAQLVVDGCNNARPALMEEGDDPRSIFGPCPPECEVHRIATMRPNMIPKTHHDNE